VWRAWCQSFANEVDVDLHGSSWARVPGTADGPSLAIVGHIDEIGVHVTHIDDDTRSAGGIRSSSSASGSCWIRAAESCAA
jgi:putative aminopeptidase FrvX